MPLKRTAGPGRPKGSKNKVTREMQSIAAAMTTGNTVYMAKLKQRLERGKCPPAVECFVLGHAMGKVPDEVRVGDPDGNALKTPMFIISKREPAA